MSSARRLVRPLRSAYEGLTESLGILAVCGGGGMGPVGRDEVPRAAEPPAARARPDRRAEALRENLKRRKAQTRARDEARRDRPDREG